MNNLEWNSIFEPFWFLRLARKRCEKTQFCNEIRGKVGREADSWLWGSQVHVERIF